MLSSMEEFRNRICEIAARAGPHLVEQSADGVIELGRCRSEMARILTIYNLFVQREIFEPLLRGSSPSEVAAAKNIKAECICLVEEFRIFTIKWRTGDVAARWAEYQPEAVEFRRRVQRHFERVMTVVNAALAHRHL